MTKSIIIVNFVSLDKVLINTMGEGCWGGRWKGKGWVGWPPVMGKAWWGGGWIIATVKVAIKENKGNKVLKENNEEYSFAKTCRGGKGWRVKGEGWRLTGVGWWKILKNIYYQWLQSLLLIRKFFTKTIFRVNQQTNSILYIVSNGQIIYIRINILYISKGIESLPQTLLF